MSGNLTLSTRFAALSAQHGELLDVAATATLTQAAQALASSPAARAVIFLLAAILLLGGLFAAYLDARASFVLMSDLRRDRDLRVLAKVEALKGRYFLFDRLLDGRAHGDRRGGSLRAPAPGMFAAVLAGAATPGERALALARKAPSEREAARAAAAATAALVARGDAAACCGGCARGSSCARAWALRGVLARLLLLRVVFLHPLLEPFTTHDARKTRLGRFALFLAGAYGSLWAGAALYSFQAGAVGSPIADEPFSVVVPVSIIAALLAIPTQQLLKYFLHVAQDAAWSVEFEGRFPYVAVEAARRAAEERRLAALTDAQLERELAAAVSVGLEVGVGGAADEEEGQEDGGAQKDGKEGNAVDVAGGGGNMNGGDSDGGFDAWLALHPSHDVLLLAAVQTVGTVLPERAGGTADDKPPGGGGGGSGGGSRNPSPTPSQRVLPAEGAAGAAPTPPASCFPARCCKRAPPTPEEAEEKAALALKAADEALARVAEALCRTEEAETLRMLEERRLAARGAGGGGAAAAAAAALWRCCAMARARGALPPPPPPRWLPLLLPSLPTALACFIFSVVFGIFFWYLVCFSLVQGDGVAASFFASWGKSLALDMLLLQPVQLAAGPLFSLVLLPPWLPLLACCGAPTLRRAGKGSARGAEKGGRSVAMTRAAALSSALPPAMALLTYGITLLTSAGSAQVQRGVKRAAAVLAGAEARALEEAEAEAAAAEEEAEDAAAATRAAAGGGAHSAGAWRLGAFLGGGGGSGGGGGGGGESGCGAPRAAALTPAQRRALIVNRHLATVVRGAAAAVLGAAGAAALSGSMADALRAVEAQRGKPCKPAASLLGTALPALHVGGQQKHVRASPPAARSQHNETDTGSSGLAAFHVEHHPRHGATVHSPVLPLKHGAPE
jgi:hypothetical protein